MQGRAKACLFVAAIAVVLAPGRAVADGYINPWVGVDVANENDEGHAAFGVTAGYMGAGVFGFEADLGYAPHFFGRTEEFGDNSIFTVMGDLILGVPIGGTHGAGIRPFVSGGLGLMRTHLGVGPLALVDEFSNDAAYNAGAGMMGFFNDHIGLRGDLRYFRTLQDVDFGNGVNLEPGRLHFWRFSGGVTFR